MRVSMATFDLDHTLVRRRSGNLVTLKMKAIEYAIAEVFGIREIHYMRHLGPELFGMTDRSIMREVLAKLGVAPETVDDNLDRLFMVMLDRFALLTRDNHEPEYEKLAGVTELLDLLSRSGVRCGLATGNYAVFARWKLKSAGLDRYFNFGGFGEDGEERVIILRTALYRGGFGDDEHACHFGDSPADIKAAREVGVLAAAVSIEAGGKFPDNELEKAGAGLIIRSYSDIETIAEFLGI